LVGSVLGNTGVALDFLEMWSRCSAGEFGVILADIELPGV